MDLERSPWHRCQDRVGLPYSPTSWRETKEADHGETGQEQSSDGKALPWVARTTAQREPGLSGWAVFSLNEWAIQV